MKKSKEFVWNENPNLLWGDEFYFVITAINAYVKSEKARRELNENKNVFFFTNSYLDQMQKQVADKLNALQQPTRPEEQEDD